MESSVAERENSRSVYLYVYVCYLFRRVGCLFGTLLYIPGVLKKEYMLRRRHWLVGKVHEGGNKTAGVKLCMVYIFICSDVRVVLTPYLCAPGVLKE